MNLLLDTHVALWAITDSPRLSPKARQLLTAPRTTVWVSVVSLPAHHQDPFDRLLVAQALTEPMCLMTHDANVAAYSDTILKI